MEMFSTALKSSNEAIIAMGKEKLQLNHARLEQEKKKMHWSEGKRRTKKARAWEFQVGGGSIQTEINKWNSLLPLKPQFFEFIHILILILS